MEILNYIKQHWPEAHVILAIGIMFRIFEAAYEYWDEGYTVIYLGKDEDPWKFISDADVILHGRNYKLNCYAIRKPIISFNVDALSNTEDREIVDVQKEWGDVK